MNAARMLLDRRTGGVLLHPTSLPGPLHCGDLGPAARAFVGQLARARQRWWQMLPVGPAGPGHSPYSSPSAFAGDPLLVSAEDLARDGLIARDKLRRAAAPSRRHADFAAAARVRERLLRDAFAAFEAGAGRSRRARLDDFAAAESGWLDDYALFMALKLERGGAPWYAWEPELRHRRGPALKAAARRLASELAYHRFVQYQFARQFDALHAFARAHGIGLAGDVPFYVELDSADVWAHPRLFQLDAKLRPLRIAGVAPDYFARDGQRWANPLWDWGELRRVGYAWWVARLKLALRRFEWVRLDHFLGFHRAWAIAPSSPTARRGRYLPGPGLDFFRRVGARLHGLPFVAEDLGTVVPEACALRDRAGLPGMRVLQFAFGRDPGAQNERPHTYARRCVVYTGTHDNDTTRGWYRTLGRGRGFVQRYLGCDGDEIHWDLIRAAHASAADTAIVPLQDVLGLGSEGRMNRPGTSRGNWEWRLRPGELTDAHCDRLAEVTATFDRDCKEGR